MFLPHKSHFRRFFGDLINIFKLFQQGLLFHFAKTKLNHMEEEAKRKRKADHLGNRERPPDIINVSRKGKKECAGNENDKLSANADEKAVNTLAESLAGCDTDNI